MDLGFGGFLEKFEDHFGRGLTKGLLILIGLAVAALCGSVIWKYLLLPVAQMIPDPKSGPAYEFLKLALILAIFLMIVNQLIAAMDNYVKRGLRRRLRESSENAQRIYEEAKELRDEAAALQQEAAETNVMAQMVLDEAISKAVAHKLVTQEQADEIRALATRPPPNELPA